MWKFALKYLVNRQKFLFKKQIIVTMPTTVIFAHLISEMIPQLRRSKESYLMRVVSAKTPHFVKTRYVELYCLFFFLVCDKFSMEIRFSLMVLYK